MTSISLTSQTTAPAVKPSIGSALRELTVAGGHLSVALLAALRRKSVTRRPLTPFEEAENLRVYARSFESTDRGFAADLYAAADRHERLHGA